MNVLYFAPRECWPLNTGARLRNYHLSRVLARGARVTYLAFADEGIMPEQNSVDATTQLSAEGRHVNGSKSPQQKYPLDWCERVIILPQERGYTPMKIARGALGSTPLTVLNYTSEAMATRLKDVLNEGNFDVVQVESIHLSAYIPLIRAARSNPLIVCDWHNIESDLMRQYSNHAANPLRRIYARRTAAQLAALERKIARTADANVMVSEPDRARLLQVAPGARAFVVENGVDVGYYSNEEIEKAYSAWLESKAGGRSSSGVTNSSASKAREPSSETGPGRNRILFVGSMDYHANIDGVRHFAASVWPRLVELLPRTLLTIVGRNPPPAVRALARLRGVEVTGTVEDVRPYYREALASVIPLQVGGGSRLKIYEALAAGVPVISTRLGAEGVDARDGESIIFAETPEEFCGALSDITENSVKWEQLAAAGRRLVSEKYDWSILGKQLAEIYQSLLNEQGRSAFT